MRIALCDDQPEQLSTLYAMVQEFFAAPGMPDTQIKTFSSSVALENYILMKGGFTLYLLDIMMPEINGIELGMRIRENDTSACIIYLTSSPDYALESYRARALQYLLKPVARERLFEVLGEAMRYFERMREICLTVKTKTGIVRLPYRDLIYAELVDRTVHYRMLDGKTVIGMTLRASFREAMDPLLEDSRFVLTCASFAVNLQYVQSVERAELLMTNGTRIPLARAQQTEVKQHWLDYWLEDTVYEM